MKSAVGGCSCEPCIGAIWFFGLKSTFWFKLTLVLNFSKQILLVSKSILSIKNKLGFKLSLNIIKRFGIEFIASEKSEKLRLDSNLKLGFFN